MNNKKEFLNYISSLCIETRENINIAIILALVIKNTNWGNSDTYKITNNMFHYPVRRKWSGKCYSEKLNKMYNNISEYNKNSSTNYKMYRVYSTTDESMKDFINYLKESKSTNNDTKKYIDILSNSNYIEILKELKKNNFLSNFYHSKSYNDWYDDIMSIIKINNLYEYDDRDIIHGCNVVDPYYNNILKINYPQKGHIIMLDNTPVYKDSKIKNSFITLSGEFYYYDNSVVNNRAKITTCKYIFKKDPSLILGYIDILDKVHY